MGLEETCLISCSAWDKKVEVFLWKRAVKYDLKKSYLSLPLLQSCYTPLGNSTQSCHMGTSTNCMILLFGNAQSHTLRSVLQICSLFSVVSEARGSFAWVNAA